MISTKTEHIVSKIEQILNDNNIKHYIEYTNEQIIIDLFKGE